MRRNRTTGRRGGALLAVLWLAAALSAIAFSVANTVRSESKRTSTAVDGVRSYYLAAGAIERAMLYMSWAGYRNPDGSPQFWSQEIPALTMRFPAGDVLMEFLPESGKLNVNMAPVEELYRLMMVLGASPERAQEIALAIVDWRTSSGGQITPFDQYYLSLNPSFPARHASFREIEELLLVKGMTPELFYGTYERGPEGTPIPRGGVRDCLSVFGSAGAVSINNAHPAVLTTIGLSPDVVAFIVDARRRTPFLTVEQVAALGQGPGFERLRVGGGSAYTLRATARLRLSDGTLSDMRRSVAATIGRPQMIPGQPATYAQPYRVLRWYDNAWAQ